MLVEEIDNKPIYNITVVSPRRNIKQDKRTEW